MEISEIREIIDNTIKNNGVGAITGNSLNVVLNEIVDVIERITPYYTFFDMSDIESWVGSSVQDLQKQDLQEQDLQNAILNNRTIRIPINKNENKGYVTCISCEINDVIYLKAIYANTMYSIDIDITGSEATVNSNININNIA